MYSYRQAIELQAVSREVLGEGSGIAILSRL